MSIPTKTHNLHIKDGKIWSRYFWSIIDLLYRAVNMRVLLISAVNLGILCKDCVKMTFSFTNIVMAKTLGSSLQDGSSQSLHQIL